MSVELQDNKLATVATTQTMTASFVDVGSEINVVGVEKLGIWIDLDINNSTDVVIQVLSKLVANGDEYSHIIPSSYSYTLPMADGFYKLPDFDTNRLMNYVQIQAKATVVGAPAAAIIRSCKITKKLVPSPW
jgi:hypothetical protein